MRCLVRDVEFNYVERGEGIPLIALHGWPLDHRHMLEPLEPLFEARPGWRRIYPDLPGMGMTPGPAWLRSQAQMVDLVLELVDSLVPGRRFVVAGASYGGWLARAIAHEMGDRLDGIFLSVPAIFDSPKPEHVVRQHDPAFLAALGPGEESAADMVVSQSVDVVESWRRNVFPGLGLADQAFLDRVGPFRELPFDEQCLPSPLRAPALILTGRFDNWCGYESAYALLPEYPFATFAVLDGAGHSLPDEKQALYRALVSDWLDRVEHDRAQRGCDGR